jgi:hypothetical protein
MAREKGIGATPEKIRESLNGLEVCEFEHGDKAFYLKMESNTLGQQLARLLRVTPPANVTPKENWKL